MGYMRHNAIIATVDDLVFKDATGVPAPDVEGFRASLPEHWQPLVVGPIPSIVNGYVTFVFAPDGSKEGWDASDNGDEYRARFVDLFRGCYSDGSSHMDVVIVEARFGGDEPGAEDEPELMVTSNIRRITTDGRTWGVNGDA